MLTPFKKIDSNLDLYIYIYISFLLFSLTLVQLILDQWELSRSFACLVLYCRWYKVFITVPVGHSCLIEVFT